MMKKKKASTILAIVTALSVLAGCGGGSAPAATGSTNGGPAQGEKPSEPVAISIMANLHTPEVPSDMIEKLLEEKTGTKLDIQWVPDGTYDEKVNASFATGTLPQVTYLKNAASLVNMRDAIRNGQFWEIGPLLDQYPNLSKLKPDVLKTRRWTAKSMRYTVKCLCRAKASFIARIGPTSLGSALRPILTSSIIC